MIQGQPVIFRPVSSLWTPAGEHKVERTPDAGGPGSDDDTAARRRGGPPTGSSAGRTRRRHRTREPRYDEASSDEVRRQLLDAPVEVVIANHAYGLFELAAIHLSPNPRPRPRHASLSTRSGRLVEGLRDGSDRSRPRLKRPWHRSGWPTSRSARPRRPRRTDIGLTARPHARTAVRAAESVSVLTRRELLRAQGHEGHACRLEQPECAGDSRRT